MDIRLSESRLVWLKCQSAGEQAGAPWLSGIYACHETLGCFSTDCWRCLPPIQTDVWLSDNFCVLPNPALVSAPKGMSDTVKKLNLWQISERVYGPLR